MRSVLKISLWRLQNKPLKIWSKEDFRIHLYLKHGIDLEDYLHVDYNNDLVIFSTDVLRASCSDVDKSNCPV